MDCPACHLALQEKIETCPRCGFDLPRAEGYFGIAPQLHSSVTDLAGILSKSEVRGIVDLLHQMDLQFPQCNFAAVVCSAPPEVPLSSYVFWLFNKGGLAVPIETGGDCHLMMFLIDVVSNSAVCMVGYGLEPLMGEAVMKRITNSCQNQLQKRHYAQAVQVAMTQADKELKQLAATLPLIFGLNDENQTANEQMNETFAY